MCQYIYFPMWRIRLLSQIQSAGNRDHDRQVLVIPSVLNDSHLVVLPFSFFASGLSFTVSLIAFTADGINLFKLILNICNILVHIC